MRKLKSDHISTCGQEQTWIMGMPGDKQSHRVMFCLSIQIKKRNDRFTKTNAFHYNKAKLLFSGSKQSRQLLSCTMEKCCCYWVFFFHQNNTLLQVGYGIPWVSGQLIWPSQDWMKIFGCCIKKAIWKHQNTNTISKPCKNFYILGG